jgi:hypothetical protein
MYLTARTRPPHTAHCTRTSPESYHPNHSTQARAKIHALSRTGLRSGGVGHGGPCLRSSELMALSSSARVQLYESTVSPPSPHAHSLDGSITISTTNAPPPPPHTPHPPTHARSLSSLQLRHIACSLAPHPTPSAQARITACCKRRHLAGQVCSTADGYILSNRSGPSCRTTRRPLSQRVSCMRINSSSWNYVRCQVAVWGHR